MEIKIIYLPRVQADLLFWKKSGNKSIQLRISKLIQSILETPFEGIGKPEALKYDYAGWWSRRINEEHRIVYRAEEDRITIA
ncbi:MAG TPA: Txe/YoeB family addiction module toxin [Mucilaginibacter sp.]